MGFHSSKTIPFSYSGDLESDRYSAIKFNVLKTLSYIPILSIPVAIFNLRAVIPGNIEGLGSYRAFVVFQSIVQIGGCGALFLPFDLVFSIHRACKHSSDDSKSIHSKSINSESMDSDCIYDEI